MKKFGKFLTGTTIVAALAAGAFYVYKNYIEDKASDEVEDIDDFEEEEETVTESADREYVSINIAKAATDENTADFPEENEEEESVNDPE